MAGPEVGVQVIGLSQLRRELRALGDNLADLKRANAAVAEFIATAARPRSPRRTGRLAASVRGNRAAGSAVVSLGGAAVPYAGPIHWGWESRHIAANPFVWETAQHTEGTWLPIYEKDIQDLCDRVRGAGI